MNAGSIGLRAKRALDVVVASVLLLGLAPLMVAIAAAIVLTSGRPVLFRQRRPGLHGEPFTMYKFRTMRPPDAGEEPWTTDEVRTTRLGAILRKASLDELPQFVQVISGRMSLVGPRPLLMEYLPRYTPEHGRRHEMRPGITGLAQVSGRRALTMGQRLDLDLHYVEHWSLRSDLAILTRTAAAVLGGGDIKGQTIADVDDLHLLIQ